MMEVMVTTAATKRAKSQLYRQHLQTDSQLLTGRMPFLSPNQLRKQNISMVGLKLAVIDILTIATRLWKTRKKLTNYWGWWTFPFILLSPRL